MKPNLITRLQETIFNLQEILGYQELDTTMDNIELSKLEGAIELLQEIEELLK